MKSNSHAITFMAQLIQQGLDNLVSELEKEKTENQRLLEGNAQLVAEIAFLKSEKEKVGNLLFLTHIIIESILLHYCQPLFQSKPN